MKKRIFTLLFLSFSIPAFAQANLKHELYPQSATVQNNWWNPSRLSIGAYGGYGDSNGAYEQDGQFAQGRLAMALRVADYYRMNFGAEVGVQSGNTMRLDASSSLIAAAGGLPIQSTLKPLVDLLITMKSPLSQSYPLFGIVKGGIAYRQLTLNDRTSSQDSLQKTNGELQIGLAWNLTNQLAMTGFYQGIYSGSNAGVGLDSAGNVTISRIPTQQAGFIGFEYTV